MALLIFAMIRNDENVSKNYVDGNNRSDATGFRSASRSNIYCPVNDDKDGNHNNEIYDANGQSTWSLSS